MAFPPSNELEFLRGQQVTQVVFQTDGVRFVCWGGAEIHAMGDFEHKDHDCNTHQFEDVFLDPPSLLHRLIQRQIFSVEVNGDLLKLSFDDGQELTFNSSPNGENGLIKFGADLTDGWIVF